MKPSQSQFHDIRGLRYHVRTWGPPDGPRIFLLHGWMDVSASFQFLVDGFAREWCAIAPDWRGFGLTEWSREGYWFPDYYADLEALLHHYQPDEPARLVGHSMGGVITCTRRVAPPAHCESGLAGGLRAGAHRARAGTRTGRYRKRLDGLREPPQFRPYRSFAEAATRLKRNNPRLDDAKAEFLARHWARETDDGSAVLRSDPRHKLANRYLFRLDELIASWRQAIAPVLWVFARFERNGLSHRHARVRAS